MKIKQYQKVSNQLLQDKTELSILVSETLAYFFEWLTKSSMRSIETTLEFACTADDFLNDTHTLVITKSCFKMPRIVKKLIRL